MKIAIFSDTHDNLPNLRKALNYLKNHPVKALIHCGDIASWETLKFMASQFTGPIYACLGNMEINPQDIKLKVKTLKNVEFFPETGQINLANKKIAFTHFPKIARELAKKQKYDLVFYGHSHFPWQKKLKKTEMLNPGTLAGMFNKATFAIYDLAKMHAQLIILEKLPQQE